MKNVKGNFNNFMIFMGYIFITLIIYTLIFGTIKIG